MKSILIVACLLSTQAWACDKQNAKAVEQTVGGLAKWNDGKTPLVFNWQPVTRDMPPGALVSMMEGFAHADACLRGKGREIDFYRDGKLLGKTLLDAGFQPVDPAFDVPRGGTIHAWLSIKTR